MCISSREIRLAYRNCVGAVGNSGNLHLIHILRLLLSARVCTADTSALYHTWSSGYDSCHMIYQADLKWSATLFDYAQQAVDAVLVPR